jgi:hypothetical protein
MKDINLTTPKGKERVGLMTSDYPRFNSLQRVQIPGPNETSLYILCHPEDFDLFNKQVRRVIEKRIPKIEEVNEKRKRNILGLEKIRYEYISVEEPEEKTPELFEEQIPYSLEEEKSEKVKIKKIITGAGPRKLIELERLSHWLPKGERPLEKNGRCKRMIRHFSLT